jgi:hypothetical protein
MVPRYARPPLVAGRSQPRCPAAGASRRRERAPSATFPCGPRTAARRAPDSKCECCCYAASVALFCLQANRYRACHASSQQGSSPATDLAAVSGSRLHAMSACKFLLTHAIFRAKMAGTTKKRSRNSGRELVTWHQRWRSSADQSNPTTDFERRKHQLSAVFCCLKP